MSKDVINSLRHLLGKEGVLTDDQLKDRYNHIWQMDKSLQAGCLVLPRSTEEVSKIMSVCHLHGQSVVVFGGLTNLVGSTETKGDEVVISLERMNAVEEVDEGSRTITVQAGAILENVQRAAKDKGLLLPLNFGAKGSAQIGGAISTNAGGLRVLRFGMTRNLVLGLEAVLPDGTIVSNLKKIIKDNSAYDLKQLFIGSEGTLGVVTRAVLRLQESFTSRTSAFVGVNGYENVVRLLRHMDAGMAGTLSAYELIWNACFKAMTSPPALVKPPLPHDYEYYVLLEGLGSDQQSDQSRLESLLETALSDGLIQDAAIAFSESDFEWFWKIREDVHAIVSQMNFDQHFDISLPIPMIGEELEKMNARLMEIEGVEQVFIFGHVADGNIHLMIGKANESDELRLAINNVVYSPLTAIGGSVSAEHGIGLHKKSYLELCRTPEEIVLMKSLKRTLDAKNILNPGKVLDM